MGETGSFKSLLVCSDGSESGEGAVREAIKLAKEQNWTVASMKKDWNNIFSFQSN